MISSKNITQPVRSCYQMLFNIDDIQFRVIYTFLKIIWGACVNTMPKSRSGRAQSKANTWSYFVYPVESFTIAHPRQSRQHHLARVQGRHDSKPKNRDPQSRPQVCPRSWETSLPWNSTFSNGQFSNYFRLHRMDPRGNKSAGISNTQGL